jgi:hypothetical protein
VGILCDAWCSPVGLLNISQAGLEPASGGPGALLFSSVMWHGDFHRLVVQGVEVLIFLGALFLPIVAPASRQYFRFIELTLSASAPYSPFWILHNMSLLVQMKGTEK